jgi:hypothetical protein
MRIWKRNVLAEVMTICRMLREVRSIGELSVKKDLMHVVSLQIPCGNHAGSLSTRRVRTACSQLSTSLEQVVIILYQGWWGQQTRNKLFQQVWYRLHVTSWWQQVRSNLLRTACASSVGTTCSKFVTTDQPCNKMITTCSRLVTTTRAVFLFWGFAAFWGLGLFGAPAVLFGSRAETGNKKPFRAPLFSLDF